MAVNDGDGTIATADDGSMQSSDDVHDSAGQFSASEKTPQQKDEAEKVRRIRDNYSFASAYFEAQRNAEKEQDEFDAVDMWDTAGRESRAEYTDGDSGRKIPARPALEVNLIEQHVQQVVSEARQARLTLSVKPKAGVANTKTSDYFKGVMRSQQNDCGSAEIRIWSLERTARLGRGAYYITSDYSNDGDFDLDVIMKRLLDQGTVFTDPYAQAANCVEDAEWGMITNVMSRKERERRWPDKKIIPTANLFEDEKDQWFTGGADPDNQMVRTAMYYEVVHTPKVLAFHPDVGNVWLDHMPPKERAEVKAGLGNTKTREVDVRKVTLCICDGQQILEESDWTGTLIPIIVTVGKEYFVQGKHRWKGVIANTMDILRAINVVLSSAVELAGSSPRSPYIMAEGQDEGFEEMWDDAAVKNFSRLYYRPTELSGKPVPPPQRQQTEPQIQALILLLRVLQDFFHSVTGSVSPQNRAANPIDRSGKAIEALQRQGAAGSSNYLDNLATISMTYEGKVWIDAIAHCYDRPGRIVQVTGEEDDDESAIMIKRPFIRGVGGVPEAVPCPACRGTMQIEPQGFSTISPLANPAPCQVCKDDPGFATEANMGDEYQGQTPEYVDFSKGRYKVVPVLDRSFKNTQEEALAGMKELATAWPEGVPAYAARWVRAMGFSGSVHVADAIDAMFPPKDADFKDEKVPPRFRAMYMQLKQEHDQSTQALQEAIKIIETDKIKGITQKEIATIKEAFGMRRDMLKSQAKIMEGQAGMEHDTELAGIKGRIEMLLQSAQQDHEIMMQLLEEKAAKDTERHSVILHDVAAQRAEERLEGQTVRAESREHGRELMAEDRDDVRTVHAEAREENRTRGAEFREEGREVRGGAREEGREVRSEVREEGRDMRADAREEGQDVRGGIREEGREVRGEVREEGRTVRGERRQEKRDGVAHERAKDMVKTEAKLKPQPAKKPKKG